MNNQEIIAKLKANHFLSATEITIGKGKSMVTAIRVESAIIFQDSKRDRILEVLEGYNVKVEKNTKDGSLVITKND